jgi:hypothetical protein
MGDSRGAIGVWWENIRIGDLLYDLGVEGRIIIKQIFSKYDGEDVD